MPRWYWWIAGAFAVRTVWEEVSGVAAGALALALLGGFWGYRLYNAPTSGEARWRGTRRELRRIVSELGEAVLGWALILLVLLGIAGIVATWPPSWMLVGSVVVVGIVAIVVLVASVAGVSNALDGIRLRRWAARRTELAPVLATWRRNALSTEPADRELVELTIKAAYARRRGLEAPDVRWASSPNEFVRLLGEAGERPRLHSPPPDWFALVPPDDSRLVWHTIWSAAGDELPVTELDSALASASGTEGLERLVEHVTWFAFRTGMAIALERPTEIHLRDGELHSDEGAAARFPDGWAVWALEGVPVPAEAIETPETFDPRVALTHENVEVRRVLLQHLGWDRVIDSSGLTPEAEDEYGRLWQLPSPDEPILLLEVENATVEDDGTHRRYFLRVPPDMGSPREATAWTFGLAELEYAPDAQS